MLKGGVLGNGDIAQRNGLGVATGLSRLKNKLGIMNFKDTLVTLICIDCGKKTFSSIQGFLNHCRI